MAKLLDSSVTGTLNVSTTINSAAFVTTTGLIPLSTNTEINWDSTRSVLNISANSCYKQLIAVSASRSANENAAGKVLACDTTAPTAVTLTFTAAAYPNFKIDILRKGTGNVIIAAGAGVTKINSLSFTTANMSGRYLLSSVYYTATNEIMLVGSIT